MAPFKDLIKKENTLNFKILNVDISIVNAIRRVLLSEIENVGFEFKPYEINNPIVKIITNTCPLHNEIILQRFALLPINLPPNNIIDFEQKKYKFILNKKNNTNNMLDVTTEDIEIYDDQNNPLSKKETLKIFPSNKYTDDFILITKLKPNLINNSDGDVIHIEAYASKNIPKNHAGLAFVSKCVYYNIVDDKKADKVLKERIKKYKEENSSASKDDIDSFTKDFNNLDRARFFYKNDFDEANFFEFDIECEYTIKPEYLMFKSLFILNDKIDKLINNITNETFKFVYVENTKNLYDIKIENEKHTLGNLIQSLLYNIFIREDNSKKISYIGYRVEHPLEDSVIIRVQINEKIKKDEINIIFIDGLEEIQTQLRKLNKDWLEFCQLSTKYANDLIDF
jgi:DNA-directed RNA polymerase subunit L|tara:strand:- start:263 stop:1453 length:1191 start_codon:yes stop_codon:yes gene_type:complete